MESMDLDGVIVRKIFNCGHVFHNKCLYAWVEGGSVGRRFWVSGMGKIENSEAYVPSLQSTTVRKSIERCCMIEN